jgi:hypothetical protein
LVEAAIGWSSTIRTNRATCGVKREGNRRSHFCRGSLFSKLDHPATDSILICHSRLHESDLIGVLRNPEPDEKPKTEEAEIAPVETAAMLEQSANTQPATLSPYWIPPCARPWWMP